MYTNPTEHTHTIRTICIYMLIHTHRERVRDAVNNVWGWEREWKFTIEHITLGWLCDALLKRRSVRSGLASRRYNRRPPFYPREYIYLVRIRRTRYRLALAASSAGEYTEVGSLRDVLLPIPPSLAHSLSLSLPLMLLWPFLPRMCRNCKAQVFTFFRNAVLHAIYIVPHTWRIIHIFVCVRYCYALCHFYVGSIWNEFHYKISHESFFEYDSVFSWHRPFLFPLHFFTFMSGMCLYIYFHTCTH